jgi:hypothetical protein
MSNPQTHPDKKSGPKSRAELSAAKSTISRAAKRLDAVIRSPPLDRQIDITQLTQADACQSAAAGEETSGQCRCNRLFVKEY